MFTASSTFEFRQILEAEYRRVAKPYTERLAMAKAFDEAQAKAAAQMKAELERQAQAIAEANRLAETHAKAKEREEHQRRLRAYFDALIRRWRIQLIAKNASN